MPTLPQGSCKTTLPEGEAERMNQSPVVPKWMLLEFGPMLGAEKAAVLFPPFVEEVTICRRAIGAVVPIPTFVSAMAELTPLMLPSTSELLWLTLAFAPMAVAFVTPAVPSARKPITVL